MNATAKLPKLKEVFIKSGALLSGHFQLSSGRHSGQYFQCALLLCEPALAQRLGRELAGLAPASWGKARTVVAPALGGVIIGHETARALKARSLFTERKDGAMQLRRGFCVERGEKVIVVEDVVTTGNSTREVITLLKGLGADVLGALAIVLRAKEPPELGAPLLCLAHLPAESTGESECPLCEAGAPIEKPGSRFSRSENPGTST